VFLEAFESALVLDGDADDVEEMGMPYRVRTFPLDVFELVSGGDWDQEVEMFLASNSTSLGS
jgi:hypothetical protein